MDDEHISLCTIVAMDHSNGLCYNVCANCERVLSDNERCICRTHNAVKRLYRLLISIATEDRVRVVVAFDRVAHTLMGCSADEFYKFASQHPFAAQMAGNVLEGKMFSITLRQPKGGYAQHKRIVSIVPCFSDFLPVIKILKGMNASKMVGSKMSM